MNEEYFKTQENLEKKWKTYLYILTISSIFFVYIMLEYLKVRTPLLVEYFNIIPFFFLLYSWIYWIMAFRRIKFLPRHYDFDEIEYYSRISNKSTRLIDLLIAAFYVSTIVVLFAASISSRWF